MPDSGHTPSNLYPSLSYDDAPAAIEWLCRAFGFTERCVRIDESDAHYVRAKAAGAQIIQELRDEDYGSRGYMAQDPEGHQWYFGTYRPGAHWGAGADGGSVAR
jgi:uncharacterized glyoxalase superfamily protein PhnB